MNLTGEAFLSDHPVFGVKPILVTALFTSAGLAGLSGVASSTNTMVSSEGSARSIETAPISIVRKAQYEVVHPLRTLDLTQPPKPVAVSVGPTSPKLVGASPRLSLKSTQSTHVAISPNSQALVPPSAIIPAQRSLPSEPVVERGDAAAIAVIPEVSAAAAPALINTTAPMLPDQPFKELASAAGPAELARESADLEAAVETTPYRLTGHGVEFSVSTVVGGASMGKVRLMVASSSPEIIASDISIRLDDLVEVLRPNLTTAEYERFSASRAASTYVSLNELRAAGVAVAFDDGDQLVFKGR